MIGNMYEEVILDHNKNPRHFGPLRTYTHHAHGDNPVCGDSIDIYLDVQNNNIENIAFTGEGCAICKASASMMTDLLLGKDLRTALSLFEDFHTHMTQPEGAFPPSLGKLRVLENVKKYPIRVKCATLPWHTFSRSLEGSDAHD